MAPGNPTADGPRPRLLRIQEVAGETGLTPRSIRYYEEIGLLKPAARSQGDYRLYDPSDLERLRFIRERPATWTSAGRSCAACSSASIARWPRSRRSRRAFGR